MKEAWVTSPTVFKNKTNKNWPTKIDQRLLYVYFSGLR